MIGLLSEFRLYILLAAFLLFFPWNDIILKIYQPFIDKKKLEIVTYFIYTKKI